LSTTSGVLCAWAFQRFTIPGRDAWYILILLPLFMPGVVLGLGVAIAFGGFSIGGFALYGSRVLVMVAHSLWAMPLVFMLMEATFKTIDYRVVEASYDLGGGPARTFFEIVLPLVSTGIISSLLFAFVISLNEFVMALFLTDRDSQTLPVLMWLSLRSAGTPRLAVASVILALTVFACLIVIILWYVRQLRKVAR
jgi:ABC-type spermidine/putrescine transport system permease subunit II